MITAPTGPIAQTMLAKLATLNPLALELIDDSARHAGHAGNPHGQGETHFKLHLVSAAFAGQSRLARQRQVLALLAAELAGPVHALTMRLQTPEEAQK